jgi:hypothetical protein
VLQPAEEPAEVAGVEVELLTQRCRGHAGGVRELEEDPHLGEREGTLQQPVVEDADAPRVKAIEATDGGDASGELGIDHGDLAVSLPISSR